MKTKPEKDLKAVLKQFKGCVLWAMLFSAFVNVLMLTSPLYMLQLYGRVVTSRSVETLVMLTIIVAFLYFSMGVFEVLRGRILVVFSNKIDRALSEKIYDGIFRLSATLPGRISSGAMNDLNTLKQYLSGNGIFAFLDAPWLPFYIAILFLFHPWFGYFGIAVALIIFALGMLNDKATRDGLKTSNDTYKLAIGAVNNNLGNAEVIHAMGMNKNLKSIWKKLHLNFLEANSEASVRAGFYTHLSKTFRQASQSFILGLGAYLVVKSEVNPGMMIAGSIVLGRALAPLDLLIGSWRGFKNAKESYERLDKFLQQYSEQPERLKLPDPAGAITLEGISLCPPASRQQTLFGISMALKPGQLCALIGASAAGKSSLARAMLGIWPVFSGTVRIDGADVQHYEHDHLGDFIGYVPQDNQLFEGTIAQNIARFGELDSEAVIKAAKDANVHEMILGLPEGYETKLAAGGAGLSGGQKQRIALARAFYKDPKIIVLDEPNASLDEAGEEALMQALLAKKGSATIVIISHKMNILQAADCIAMLHEGRLVKFGARDEMMAALGYAPKPVAAKKPKIEVSLDSAL